MHELAFETPPTYVAIFSFLHPGRCTYVYMLRARLYYDTYAPLLRHVRSSTSTSIYVRTCSGPELQCYVRFDQVGPDCQALPCLRRCSWWVPAVRGANRFGFFAQTHFLACEDVAGGSQQSGGKIVFFARTHFLTCEGVAGGSPQSGGESFFSDALPCVRRCS